MSDEGFNKNDSVVAFVDAARRYCTLIESHASLSKTDFVMGCAERLALLYARAVALLEVDTDAPSGTGKGGPSHDAWQKLFDSLGEKFGEDNAYWHVAEPYK